MNARLSRLGTRPTCRWRSCEQAVAKAGLDRDKMRQTIATETFDTINGPVKFEGVQNATTPTAFLQVQDGQVAARVAGSVATAKSR